MSTAYTNGQLKDSTPDEFCSAVVLNHENGKKLRFRTMAEARIWADERNQKLAEDELAPRFYCYPPDQLPAWYLKWHCN